MTRSLLVFINRKLISIDTILPLICEVKNYKKNIKIKVICPDHSTFSSINKNLFIRDQIENNADLIILSLRNHEGKRTFKSILQAIIYLIYICKEALLFKTAFIHFGLLFKTPFKYLNILNRNHVFFAESDSYGFTQLMQDVTFLEYNSPRIYPDTSSSHLISFSKNWYLANHKRKKNKNTFYFGTPRTRKFWKDLLKLKSEKYISDELKKNNILGERQFISIMLGYFGELKYLSNKDSVANALEDTINVLSKCIKNEVLILKPHVITDIEIVEKILSKYKNIKYIISNLHPMVLASRTKFAIANYYSTTLSDFKSLGVKTLEYTDYCDEALILTNNGSLRPDKVDYFINKNPSRLEEVINILLKNPEYKKPEIKEENPNELFSALVGKV